MEWSALEHLPASAVFGIGSRSFVGPVSFQLLTPLAPSLLAGTHRATVKHVEMKKWHERIESDPHILRGKPCIKGTRIPAALILGYLAAGRATEQIIEQFPDLTPADIFACLDFARDLADFEAVAAA